ncbi:ubiquitin-protein ligase E3A [Condylostylus longicornis]|uniref:ubiquitin-protein ligase E3A n=1 Tax=Condylostylus longicornis TaxID=2530218 RepID=UPI00244DFD4F|nr:ubiquitin-protein ligase E3A [Condylostylus longicornis]
MNSEKKENLDGETSRDTEESSSVGDKPDQVNNIYNSESSETILPIDQNTKINCDSNLTQNDKLNVTDPNLLGNIITNKDDLDSETPSDSEQGVLTNDFKTFPATEHSLDCTPTSVTTSSNNHSSNCLEETEEMKRAAARKLIERYFYQLLHGCGNSNCKNKYCASSGEIEELTPNQAAARAIQLFSQDAKLCDTTQIQPSKIARTSPSSSSNVSEILNTSDAGQSSSFSIESNNSNSLLNNPEQSSRDLNDTSYPRSTTSNTYKLNNRNDGSTSSSNATTPSSHSSSASASSGTTSSSSDLNLSSSSHKIKRKPVSSPTSFLIVPITSLDEEKLTQLIDECKSVKSYTKLIRTIGEVFSSTQLLSGSFRKKPKTKIDEVLEKVSADLKSLKKEDIRSLESDPDKDEDSCASENAIEEEEEFKIDIESLRRSMEKLFSLDCPIYEALNNGLHSLSILLTVDLMTTEKKDYIENVIYIMVLVYEIMAMAPSEFLENALPNICGAAAHLPVWAEAKLARIWAEHCKSSLNRLLQTLQQLISLQVITGNFGRSRYVENSEVITSATKVLKILYYANILAGTIDSTKLCENENGKDSPTNTFQDDDDFMLYTHLKNREKKLIEDSLEKELGVSAMDCRIPLIPFEEFYNEPLSETIEMDNDYLYYKNYTMDIRPNRKFTFMLYSFILTPATKVVALYYDSRVRMYSERRLTIFQHISDGNGAGPNPYLKIRVRREKLIEDALLELEMVAMATPKDFKKQLVVEFADEQGIDEGGVSKEFFQLVVDEIFNPDFGMFVHQEDTKTVWFNSNSFENDAQFTLIGIVLGLAIYNNVILAVNFPMVVYRKLMGGRGSFYDLADFNPIIFKSLKSMLDYTEVDMEDVFMQTFKISYTDVFGNLVEHELKEGGADILVNQENKLEFIELYADYLLNTSIDRQFKAFKKGFEMVTDESPLKLLFRPEEIELLVCGSRKFDFIELEKSTEYEGGYTENSQIIKDFWNIVHGLSMESKRKLLEFTTGSDRVPVGGLSKLKLVIARNGPDCDRLPTSHTCFNVLLLPEYENREKLEDRLLKAINYSKGFGML